MLLFLFPGHFPPAAVAVWAIYDVYRKSNIRAFIQEVILKGFYYYFNFFFTVVRNPVIADVD